MVVGSAVQNGLQQRRVRFRRWIAQPDHSLAVVARDALVAAEAREEAQALVGALAVNQPNW